MGLVLSVNGLHAGEKKRSSSWFVFIGESVVRSFDRSLFSLLAYSSLCSVFRFFVEQSFVCSFIRLFMLSVLKNFRYPTLPSP